MTITGKENSEHSENSERKLQFTFPKILLLILTMSKINEFIYATYIKPGLETGFLCLVIVSSATHIKHITDIIEDRVVNENNSPDHLELPGELRKHIGGDPSSSATG